MSEIRELKPCPFCGGEAKFKKYKIAEHHTSFSYYVVCTSCNVQTAAIDLNDDRPIDRWNNRPENSANEEITELLGIAVAALRRIEGGALESYPHFVTKDFCTEIANKIQRNIDLPPTDQGG